MAREPVITHDIFKKPEFEVDYAGSNLRIVRGLRNAGLESMSSTDATRYIFMMDGGDIRVKDGPRERGFAFPGPSVLKVPPGLRHRVAIRHGLSGYIFDVTGVQDVDFLDMETEPTEEDVNKRIYTTHGVTVHPEGSRFNYTTNKPSNWYTERRKGSTLGIADVEWKKAPFDTLHTHAYVQEIYIVRQGRMGLQVGDDVEWHNPGALVVINPASLTDGVHAWHRIVEVKGPYKHIQIHTPSLVGNSFEKLLPD